MYDVVVRHLVASVFVGSVLASLSGEANAVKPHPANVPPTEEIEVISPGVDPLDRPAAVLVDGENGEQQVDIPPTVLVHKYYYTGDRSFQAQLLPGGPCIVVVTHPKTGDRCYVELQMMPGAPYVTYTSRSILYDYGEHSVTLAFPRFGRPVTRHRNGLSLPKKIGKLVHAPQIWQHTKGLTDRVKNTAGGALVKAGQVTNTVAVQPIKQVAGMLPFGQVLFSGDLEDQLTQTYLQHQREHQVKHAQKQAERLEPDFRTVR